MTRPPDPDSMILGDDPIAPWWHTVLVLVPLAALSVASWYQRGLAHVPLPGISTRLASYLTVIAAEWIQALLIILALKHRGLSVGSLVRGRWPTVRSFLLDLALAIGFLVVAIPVSGLLLHFVMSPAIANMSNFTPKTVAELVAFLVAATTGGGFCEELIFRGYLTQQFRAWTGNRAVSVFLQGVVFGLGHGYYGIAMVVVMVLGWLLGTLAEWRKTLRPGMLAHGIQDSLGGVLAFLSK